MKASLGFRLAGALAGVLAITLVTVAISLLDTWAPVLSLGALYVFAVVPIAVVWGMAYAIPVAVASMLAFNFFFLEPLYTFTLADGENWVALAVYLVSAVIVGELAARGRRQAAEAEQREREAALLADVAAELLKGTTLNDVAQLTVSRAGDVLGVTTLRIDLSRRVLESSGEAPYPLEAGGRTVGTLYTPEDEEIAPAVQRRLLPALASLLGVTAERERLAREATDADALRHSDTIKTAVIQTVSHDLRTPLATIEQALDGLESGVLSLSDDDRRELLDTIRVEHARLKRLVENLLDLSRLQAGAAESMPALWTADELVAQALDELAESGRVVVSIRPDLPPVRVDAAQIQRVLVNVLENALRISPPGETVHVRATATRKELLIRITDHGPGVPDEERDRIFEAFHRVGRVDGRGAGLGLTIARGFTEANAGRLWLESRPGQGASFVLALPAVELPAEVTA